ncbi:hypothetical protein OTU49_011455 [Cherax quadricarinatus]|uniref:Uncharacterized protein n=1 Tax=Cherax quadricarinatus TaxID=27406 RepID=A0AAW0W305_CHEQU
MPRPVLKRQSLLHISARHAMPRLKGTTKNVYGIKIHKYSNLFWPALSPPMPTKGMQLLEMIESDHTQRIRNSVDKLNWEKKTASTGRENNCIWCEKYLVM